MNAVLGENFSVLIKILWMLFLRFSASSSITWHFPSDVYSPKYSCATSWLRGKFDEAAHKYQHQESFIFSHLAFHLNNIKNVFIHFRTQRNTFNGSGFDVIIIIIRKIRDIFWFVSAFMILGSLLLINISGEEKWFHRCDDKRGELY